MSRRALRVAGRELAIGVPAAALLRLEALLPVEPAAADGGRRPDFAIEERAGGGWQILVEGSPAGERRELDAAVEALEYEIERSLPARLDDRICLHAGAVATPEGAVLLAGKPDRGKTATTLQLLELGHALLCEEIAPVEPGSLRVDPFPRSLGVTGAYLEELERHFPLAAGAVEPLAHGQARYRAHRVATEPLAATWILLPRFDPGAGAELARLRPEDVLTELLGYCFEPAIDPEAHLDAVVELLERTTVARFTYPDPRAARRMLGELFAAP